VAILRSGEILIVDANDLPGWAAFIGKCLPLHYAVNIFHEIPMTKKSQTEINISSWGFHLTFKNQIIYR